MKSPERVLICYSGHNSSTLDLSSYIATGFQKNGVAVKRFRLDNEIRIAYDSCAAWQERKPDYHMTQADPIYLASKNLLSDIVLYKPDLVLVVTGLLLYGSAFLWLREMQEGMRKPFILGILLTESPYQDEEELHCASLANIIWTNERAFVPRLAQFTPRAFWLPHAYEDTVHFPDDSGTKEFDAYFCGTGKPSRAQLWAETDWTGVDFHLEGVFPDLLSVYPHMAAHYSEGLVPNAQAAQRCRQSRICLNRHRRESTKVLYRNDDSEHQVKEVIECMIGDGDAECVNDRAIQIAACGAFQLCDRERIELGEAFGDSIPTYGSPVELRAQVLYYLKHESERERKAAEAYARIKHRTYAHNAATMLRQIAEVF